MTDKPDVFMPLYIGDYLAGTSRLTTELHGAYLLLIMDYWMNGPLPDDDTALASIARMTPDAWSVARAQLKHYFSVDDGCWKQKRIEEELAAATEKKRNARAKAKKAAEAMWQKRREAEAEAESTGEEPEPDAPSSACAELELCPSPSPSPSPSDNTTTKEHVSPKGDTYPEEFEEIWQLKPKREGGNPKNHAFSAYKASLKRGATVEEIKAGVIRYKEYCDRKGLTNTDKVQQMRTFFGKSEGFREEWTVTQETVRYEQNRGSGNQGQQGNYNGDGWAEGFDPLADPFADLIDGHGSENR